MASRPQSFLVGRKRLLMKTPELFRSLKSRNYRLFFIGQGVSLIGTWMHQIAMGWLVYQLTGSALALGTVLFCGQAPSLFLSPFVGVFIDRWDRARVFKICQWVEMVQAFVLAGLALSGMIAVWHIMALSLVSGLAISFDMVARQALMIRLVEKKQDLSNAIALSSAMFNLSRLIGPALGGMILAATSAGVCFLINGISFVAVILSLFLMRLPKQKKITADSNVWGGLQEGLRYVWNEPALRNILALVSIGSLTSSVHVVLLPVIAQKVLGGGPQELGWLGAAIGIGALGAALLLASRKTVNGVETWIGAGSVIFGVMLAAIAFSQSLATMLGLFLVFGFGMVAHFAASNTMIQSVVTEDKRGRVMSFFSMSLIGMTPIGSLIFGAINDHYGPQSALAVGSFFAIVAGTAFLLWLPRLRGRLRAVVDGFDVVT